MNKQLSKQFETTRNALIKKAESISNELVNVQPNGFNNTIHWHIGHVLTVTEQFVFGFPHQTKILPENYIDLFGNGSKPSDWKTGVPEADELIIQLKDQLSRILEIPEDRLQVELKKPFMGCETYGELAGFSLMHEANHIGQMHAMKRMLEHSQDKN